MSKFIKIRDVYFRKEFVHSIQLYHRSDSNVWIVGVMDGHLSVSEEFGNNKENAEKRRDEIIKILDE